MEILKRVYNFLCSGKLGNFSRNLRNNRLNWPCSRRSQLGRFSFLAIKKQGKWAIGMAPPAKAQVLRNFHPLAHSLAFYIIDNFSPKLERHVLRQNILRAIGSTVLFLSVVSCWASVQPELKWSERAYHLVVIISLVQQLFIFVAMARRNRKIIDALGRFREVIDSREPFFYLWPSFHWASPNFSDSPGSISFKPRFIALLAIR